MDQAHLDQLANMLDIEITIANDFVDSLDTGNLAGLMSNIEGGNVDEVETEYSIYLSNVNDYFDEDTHTDLDKEFEIRKAYEDLRRDGLSHDRTSYQIMIDFGLDSDQELIQILKGPKTEFTGVFDEQINNVFEKIQAIKAVPGSGEGELFKGLSAEQVDHVIRRSVQEVGDVIKDVMTMRTNGLKEAYLALRGLKTVSLLEYPRATS